MSTPDKNVGTTNKRTMNPQTKKLLIIVTLVIVGIFAAFQGYKYIQHQRHIAYRRQMFETQLAERKFDELSGDISPMLASGLLTECFPDTGALIDMLLEQCEVYKVQPGLGGYYDGEKDSSSAGSKGLGAEGMQSIGTQLTGGGTNNMGDFRATSFFQSKTYGGLDSQELKDEYNKSVSVNRIYCRGEEIFGRLDGEDLKKAVDDGAMYILCGRGRNGRMDSLILLSETKLYALQFGFAIGFDAIEGDFSKELEKVAAAYHPD